MKRIMLPALSESSSKYGTCPASVEYSSEQYF